MASDNELGRLSFTIDASIKKFTAGIDDVKKEIQTFSKETQSAFSQAGGKWQDFVKGFFAYDVLKNALNTVKNLALDCVKSFDDQAVTMAKLRNQIGDGAEGLNKFAVEQQKVTRFAKDDTLAAEAQLANYIRSEDQIKKIMPAIMDYAAATGTALPAAAQLFSRALLNSGESLGRYHLGIQGTSGSQERLNSIVEKSEKYWGGTAKAIAQVGSGPLVIINNQINDLKDSIGEALNPSLLAFATNLKDIAPAVEACLPALNKIFQVIEFNMQLVATKNPLMSAKIVSWTSEIAKAQTAKDFDRLTELRKQVEAEIETLQMKPHYSKAEMDVNEKLLAQIKGATKSLVTPIGGSVGKGPLEAPEDKTKISEQKKIDEQYRKLIDDNKTEKLKDDEAALKDQDRWDKQYLELVKTTQDEELKILKEQYDAKEVQRKEEEAKVLAFRNNLMAQYVMLGQGIGDAIASGIGKGGEGFKMALKGIITVFLNFLEQQLIGTILSNALANVTASGPFPWIGAAKAAAEAAGITAVFEVAKAAINAKEMGDGGYLSGRSHSQGGIPIEAEGGEYIQRRDAVNYYGVNVMEAINRRLIPKNMLTFTSNLPATMPQGRAATGGLMTGKSGTSIVNFIDPRLMEKYLASSDGQKAIVNVIGRNDFEVKRTLGI